MPLDQYLSSKKLKEWFHNVSQILYVVQLLVFSPGAGARMRRYLRSCLPEYRYMVTLTYPFSYPCDGATSKNHLRKFLQELKREYYRHADTNGSDFKDHSSFWFLEFQQRGAPHYHIFTTWAPDKEWVSRRWYEIVRSEDIRHLHAGTRTEILRTGRSGTISYAAKYAAKAEQKQVPAGFENVGRFWGVHGRRSTVEASTFVSLDDMDVQRVRVVIKQIFEFINRLIWEGRAEIRHRNSGCLVVNLQEHSGQVKLRAMVSKLGCASMRFDNMFYDAELDNGETLSCRLSA